jgi:hypothetical protein
MLLLLVHFKHVVVIAPMEVGGKDNEEYAEGGETLPAVTSS